MDPQIFPAVKKLLLVLLPGRLIGNIGKFTVVGISEHQIPINAIFLYFTGKIECVTLVKLSVPPYKFIGDEAAVIHEVDEENNPEDAASEAQRHTILKEE